MPFNSPPPPLCPPAPAPALQAAVCCSLCNDSHLTYAADRGVYQRVGEATEVALRVLAEKVRGAGARCCRCCYRRYISGCRAPGVPASADFAGSSSDSQTAPRLLLPPLAPAGPLLLPQIGLPGYSSMPAALAAMPRQERATYCNDHWQQEWKKVFTLEFSRWGCGGGIGTGQRAV